MGGKQDDGVFAISPGSLGWSCGLSVVLLRLCFIWAAVSGEGVLAMVLIWLAAVRQCVGVIVGARRRCERLPTHTAW